MSILCRLGLHDLKIHKKNIVVMGKYEPKVVKSYFHKCVRPNCDHTEDKHYVQSIGFMSQEKVEKLIYTRWVHATKNRRVR